jgi:hypothetical protein
MGEYRRIAHEKINSCERILPAKEKVKPHMVREMSLPEVVWFIGYLGFHTRIRLPTSYTFQRCRWIIELAFGELALEDGLVYELASAADGKLRICPYGDSLLMPSGRMCMEEYDKSCISIDRTSSFNVRPPELITFDRLQVYNECFVTGRLRLDATVTDRLECDYWIDGAGRQVQV